MARMSFKSRRHRKTQALTIKEPIIKYSKYANNLGYDEVIRAKQEEYAIWYSGDSNALLDFYINMQNFHQANYESFWNAKDYFWAVVGKEDDVKCTHSGLSKVMIDLMTAILGQPEISVATEIEVKDEKNPERKILKKVKDIEATDRIKKIIEDNNFYEIHRWDQVPYMMAIGDGAYFINIDPELSDYPIIEFLDGRNVEFERKANRIIAITARKYFVHKGKGYMLTDRRSTKLVEDTKTGKKKRAATVEYHLYELKNLGTDEVSKEVELNTIPDTKHLESLEFHNIDCMLAVPCVFRLNKDTGRGESVYAGKLDSLDDLDQSLSQESNTTRLSTPVDYVPEDLLEYNQDGKPIPPKRYDRRYMTVPAGRNSVGEDISKIQTTQPQLNFNQYTDQQKQKIANILAGFMSPATLGIDIALKDNADAQREKEKVTLITRDLLVDMQTQILQSLFKAVLKVHDYMQKSNEPVGDYEITIGYPEYASPTFENKLSYLTPAFASNGLSAKQYVNELWGDSLSEEEKEEEVRILEQYKNAFQQMQNFNSMGEDAMLAF